MQQYPNLNGGPPMLPPKPGMMGSSMNINGFQPNSAPAQGVPNPTVGFPPTGNNTGTQFYLV